MALSRSMVLFFLVLLSVDIWTIDAGLAGKVAKGFGEAVLKEVQEEGAKDAVKGAEHAIETLVKHETEEKKEIGKVENQEAVVENDEKQVEKAEENAAIQTLDMDEKKGTTEDEKRCLLESTQFQGSCSSDACAGVCVKEGLLAGKCMEDVSATLKCFCKKPAC